ncbi:hypothetical protein LTR17_007176 [Elasticomyces elasticus]|nr:hypothetical protein LTR17_007176 [Elasticomyces elasticus]
MESNIFTGSNCGGIQGGNVHIGGNVNLHHENFPHRSDTSVNYNCLRSLSYRGMSSEIAYDPAAPYTCNWIFYDQQYWSWAGNGGTFSIVGRAGCGKSTLMQHMVKFETSLQEGVVELRRDAGSDEYPQIDILCFRFRGNQEEPEFDMLRSLLHQMLCDNPDLLAHFVTISGFEKRCRTRGDHGSKWDWTVSELRTYFPSLVGYARQRYHVIRIYLDNIDERVADICRRLIRSVPAKFDPVDGAVGVCYSCRPNCHLDIRYDFRIGLEAYNVNDIVVYVRDQFMTRARSGEITRDEGEIGSIMRALIERASSCFQWLVWVCPVELQYAMGSERVDYIVSRIRGFSPELGAVYAHQLSGIPTKDVPQALRVFQWLLHGKDVLSAPVLRDAVCLVDGRRYGSPEDIKDSEYWCDDASVYADRVIRLGRGLVVGGRLPIDLDDRTPKTVHVLIFDHDSVSDFMLETGLRMLHDRLPRHLPRTPLAKVESSMAGKCLSYLICCRLPRRVYDATAEGRACESDADNVIPSPSGPRRDSVSDQDFGRPIPSTFKLYAYRSWSRHLEAAEAANDLTGIVEVLDRIDFNDWSLVSPGHLNLLHMLCTRKLDRTLLFLLGVQQKNDDVGAPYDELRRRCRSEVNVQSPEGSTPMAIAAMCDRYRAVEILAEHGAGPNIPGAHGWTPLHIAADKGHEAVVRALLSCRGVNVDARNKEGRVPLSMAVIADHLPIADLLLHASSFGAHCEEVSQYYECSRGDGSLQPVVLTPLMSAFRRGSKSMLTLLLTCSKINKRLLEKHGRSLLHTLLRNNHYAGHAGHNDYKDKLHMLIHSGKLDLNAEDEDGRSVLFYACMYGDACAVQSLLFSKEVNLGTRDRSGETALEIAIKLKHTDIVRLFVEAKAGLNIKCDHDHDDGMAPLALAADMGRADVVELLLSSSEVDIRAWDDTKSTALSRAVEQGHTACVKLLLKADGVCCRECCGKTLLTAVGGGYLELVQTLVQATSDEFGPLETVEIMLQHGIVVGSGTGPPSSSVLDNADEGRLRPDDSTDDLAARQQITQYLEKYVSNVHAVYGDLAPQKI